MIAVIQAPFLRLLGSQNRRPAPAALLDANLLKAAGYDVFLIHADALLGDGARLGWSELYKRSAEGLHRDPMLDQLHVIWPELQQRMAQVKPDAAVVLAGDWVEPAKDIADPTVAIELGRLIAQLDLPCIAVGGLPSRFPERFAETFSSVVSGLPGRTLIDAIQGLPPDGIVPGRGVQDYLDVPATPCGTDTSLDYSQVVTEFGCHYGLCSGFCPIARLYGPGTTVRPDELVVRDIQSRREKTIHVIDACWCWDAERWARLANPLARQDKRFVVTTRIEFAIQPAAQKLFRRIGCQLVKLGVESLSDPMLQRMCKKQTAREVMDALRLLHEAGMRVFGYLLLGFPGETKETLLETLERARELSFVDWLPNVFCPAGDDRPEVHHFSSPQAARLGLPQEIITQFFELNKASS